MSGNGYGPKRVNAMTEMALHDRAPAGVRWLANYAVALWAMEDLVRNWIKLRQAGLSGEEVLRKMAAHMHRSEARQTGATYGPTHPEAGGRA